MELKSQSPFWKLAWGRFTRQRRGGMWNHVCYDRIRGDRRCTVVRRVKRRGGKIPTRIRKYSLGGCGPEWAKSI